ncbi:MAG: DUF4423 domain-containing protein, partial [Proteobacteria bacterium]
LVLKGRAADPAIRKMADEKLKKLKQSNEDLGSSLPAEKIRPADDSEYYLNWIYSAVHMLLTLQKDQSILQISQRLGVSDVVVKSVLQGLQKMGLAAPKNSNTYRATKKNIHLGNRNWMASLQHRNWRIASTERIGRPGSEDLRYTGVHSLSKKDLDRLRDQLREFFVNTDKLVRPSAEETVAVLCVDLFEL